MGLFSGVAGLFKSVVKGLAAAATALAVVGSAFGAPQLSPETSCINLRGYPVKVLWAELDGDVHAFLDLEGERWAIPAEAIPSNAIPSNVQRSDAIPAEAIPAEAIPSNAIPSNVIDPQLMPPNAIPAEFIRSNVIPSHALPAYEPPLGETLTLSGERVRISWTEFDGVVHAVFENKGVRYAIPSNAIPAEAIPAEAIPSNALPAEAIPSNAIPAEAIPSNATPLLVLNRHPVKVLWVEGADLVHAAVENNGVVQAIPSNAIPAEAIPFNAIPSNAIPFNAIPAEAIPSNALPAEAIPSNAIPAEAIPSNANPNLMALNLGVTDINTNVLANAKFFENPGVLESAPVIIVSNSDADRILDVDSDLLRRRRRGVLANTAGNSECTSYDAQVALGAIPLFGDESPEMTTPPTSGTTAPTAASDDLVRMPPLVGMLGRDAVARLTELGLQGGCGEACHYVVSSSDPAAGTLVPRGTRVTLRLSPAPDQPPPEEPPPEEPPADEPPEHIPPTAVDDPIVVSPSEVGVWIPVDVLDNDFDPDSAELTVVSVSCVQACHRLDWQRFDTYVEVMVIDTAEADELGVIRYTVLDEVGGEAQADIRIDISGTGEPPPPPPNNPPVAEDDSDVINPEDLGVWIPISVLDNDFDPDGDDLQVVAVDCVQDCDGLSWRIAASGTYVEVMATSSDESYVLAILNYTISDGRGGVAGADIWIDVYYA